MSDRVKIGLPFGKVVVCAASLLAWLTFAGPEVLAQGAGNAADPGRIQDRIERPKEFPKKEAPLALPGIPKGPEAEEAGKFRLIGAEIIGSTVYSAARLGDFYEPYLNREVSPADIDTIIKAITEQYQKDGYFLTRVIAPQQQVEFGVLRLQVIEGYVEEVVYKGDKPGRAYLFDAWASRITGERPLRLGTLERNLLLMAGVPGLSVTPGLKEKNAEQGSYVLNIELKHSKIEGFVSFDNRGTTAVGPLQLYTGVNVNSVVGWLERTRLAFFTIPATPEELLYFEFQQEHILNSHGTQGWFFASRSSIDIGDTIGQQENSHGTRVTLGFSHPWIRSRDLNFFSSIKFDGFDSDKNSTSSAFDDKIRSLRLGVRLNGTDSYGGSSSIATEFSKGFHILHASNTNATLLSRTNGRSDYLKATLDVSRTQKLIDKLQLEAYASAQWSPHTL